MRVRSRNKGEDLLHVFINRISKYELSIEIANGAFFDGSLTMCLFGLIYGFVKIEKANTIPTIVLG